MKKCKQRPNGFSKPVRGKIICKHCDEEIEAGSRRCPKCNYIRVMSLQEMHYCGIEVKSDWSDIDHFRQNKSGGRGGERRALFSIDSGEFREDGDEY